MITASVTSLPVMQVGCAKTAEWFNVLFGMEIFAHRPWEMVRKFNVA